MFRLKILGHRKVDGVKVTIVRDGLLEKAWKIATEYSGEIRIRGDILNAYERRLKEGLTQGEMHSVMLHEIYHQKSFTARPYIWKRMEPVRRLLFVSWIVFLVSTLLLVFSPVSWNARLITMAVALLSGTILLALGLKLHVWIHREQEASADGYEAMRANKPEATKRVKENLSRKSLLSQKKKYIAEHGTLKERKAWIDSVTQK